MFKCQAFARFMSTMSAVFVDNEFLLHDKCISPRELVHVSCLEILLCECEKGIRYDKRTIFPDS